MARPGVGSSFDDFAYCQNCEPDASERVRTMLEEEVSFICGDYISKVQTDGMEENWRRQITEWCFQVCDYYNYSRETASLAISILDRYMTTVSASKMDYQLASLCSLLIAVKYCEGTPPKMANFVMLAADRFLPENVVTMEKAILDRIGWRIMYPTPAAFVRAMLTYLNASQDTMQQILQGVQYLVELASCEYFFVSQRPSNIAFGSILNILVRDNVSLPDGDRSAWLDILKSRFNLDESNANVQQCRECLQQLYDSVRTKDNASNANVRQSPVSCEKDNDQDTRNISPTGVEEITTATENLRQGSPSEAQGTTSPNDRPRKRARS